MRTSLSLLLLTSLLHGCEPDPGDCVDEDGDGAGVGDACEFEDCDDTDPDVQECGGEDDDADADGFTADEDCDDDDAEVFPGATERCNGIDDDCDGTVDNDAVDGATRYADADTDTFGDAGTTVVACTSPAGHVADATDCDDANPAVFPGADELCNSVDDDCDASVDEDATDTVTWFADTDGDTFGDAGSSQDACSGPLNHVADSTDCDDAVNTTFPGADELCNGVDDDCDSVIDDSPIDEIMAFADADQDSFGASPGLGLVCSLSLGEVDNGDDCDDADPRAPVPR